MNNKLWKCGCKLTRKYFGVRSIEERATEDLYADLGKFVAEHRRELPWFSEDGTNEYGSANIRFEDPDFGMAYEFVVNWCGVYDNEKHSTRWDYFWTIPGAPALYHCVTYELLKF